MQILTDEKEMALSEDEQLSVITESSTLLNKEESASLSHDTAVSLTVVEDGFIPIPGPKGDPGRDGQNGVSVTHSWDGTVLTVTSASGTSSSDLKGEKGDPGGDGQPGVSVTHSWNGTVLTVTSASGTSSSDLKGERGDPGRDGQDGSNGINGVSVSHYWDGAELYITSSSGTSSAFLMGPQGEQGEPGPKGDPGESYDPQLESASLGAGAVITTATDAKVYRKGFLGFLQLHTFKTSSTLSNGTAYKIATIPSGFRPAIGITKDLILTSSGTRGHINISTNGDVTLIPRANITANTNMNICETFII